MVYAIIGIPLTVLCITKIGKAMASLVRALYNGTVCGECRRQFLKRGKSIDKDDEDCDGEPSNQPTHKHTEVPILICLALAVWYIIFGSIMFTIWEDWSYFTGAYFCFITLRVLLLASLTWPKNCITHTTVNKRAILINKFPWFLLFTQKPEISLARSTVYKQTSTKPLQFSERLFIQNPVKHVKTGLFQNGMYLFSPEHTVAF